MDVGFWAWKDGVNTAEMRIKADLRKDDKEELVGELVVLGTITRHLLITLG